MKVYACYNNNIQMRKQSSSGGIFGLFAEYILSMNGVVYGVAMSEDMYSAKYLRITSTSDLKKILGSKYLQANVNDTFLNVKYDLMDGKWVLFSGTGCQVNGLRCFLGKDYDKLLCVDVICHGVPSPLLWRKYAKHLEQQYGGKLKEVNFRNKSRGWSEFNLHLVLHSKKRKIRQLCKSKDTDSYMQMFLRDYSLRPSCYNCVAKKIKLSDLTMADFWGISKVAPRMNDGHGTSLIIIRTKKGEMLFDSINSKINVKEVSYEDGVRFNPSEYKSCDRPSLRDDFYNDMNSIEFTKFEQKYSSPIKMSLINRVKKFLKLLISLFGGQEYSVLYLFDYKERKS